MYSEDGKTDPIEVRTLADWVVRQRLLTIPGVAQVVTMGGGRKQYQVLVNPESLLKYDVTLEDIERAVGASNANATGGYLDEGGNELLVRSLGRIQEAKELENVVVKSLGDRPILLGQVARVVERAQVKRGDAAVNGKPAVMLVVAKQPGADTRTLTDQVIRAIVDLKPSMPTDIRLNTDVYQQKEFIDLSIQNVVEGASRWWHFGRDRPVPVPAQLPHDLHHTDGNSAVHRGHRTGFQVAGNVDQYDDARRLGSCDLVSWWTTPSSTWKTSFGDCGKTATRPARNPHSVWSTRPAARSVTRSCSARYSLSWCSSPCLRWEAWKADCSLLWVWPISFPFLRRWSYRSRLRPVLSYWLLPQARFMQHDQDGPLLRFLKWIAGYAIRISVRHPWPILGAVAAAAAVYSSALTVTRLAICSRLTRAPFRSMCFCRQGRPFQRPTELLRWSMSALSTCAASWPLVGVLAGLNSTSTRKASMCQK